MTSTPAPDLDPLARPSAAALGPADRAFVEACAERVIAVHANETHWWNNGSFALPLLGAVICIAFGLIFGIGEATGFGLFLGAIALFMLCRVAVTGKPVTPPLFETMAIVGRDACLERLAAAARVATSE